MISKELLIQIIDDRYDIANDQEGNYKRKSEIFLECNGLTECWNLHELASLCKIWAIKNHICISSGNGLLKDSGFYCSVDGFMPVEEHIEYADSEPEAIFKACENLLKGE